METSRFLMISTHYPPYNLGGDAFFVEYLSKELVKRGHEVHVAYSPGAHEILRGKKSHPMMPHQHDDPITHEFRKLGRRADVVTALSLGAARGAKEFLDSLVRTTKPDVIHWHNTKGFIGTPAVFRGALSLYTAHDYYAVCPRSNLLRPNMTVCTAPRHCVACNLRWRRPPPIWRTGARRIISFPSDTHVIAPSEFMSERLRRDGIIADRVLQNFVPDSAAPSSTEEVRLETITYAGLMEPHKGAQTLLRAFFKSADQHGLRLVMVGEGSLRKGLSQEVDMHRLKGRVALPGFVTREELHSIRNASIAHAIPSQWPENSPLTALESLSMGVPLIASNAGGLPEIATPESGSRTYPFGDVNALADLLVSVWESRHDIDQAKRMARKSYEERFTPSVHMAKYQRMISELPRP